jgi:hypothetical protein
MTSIAGSSRTLPQPVSEKSGRRRAAEKCDELASFQLIELHSIPPARAGLQDNELARISQEVTERFSSLFSRWRRRPKNTSRRSVPTRHSSRFL